MCTTDAPPLELVRSGLARLVAADVVNTADAVVAAELRELLAAANMLHAAICARVASFDVRELAQADGLHTTRTWLGAFGRMSQGAASGWLARSRLLRDLPALARAAGQGRVSAEQVAKVVQLADRVGAGAVRDFDEVLAEVAATAGPGEVHKACERIYAHLDPDGPDPDPGGDLDRRELTLSPSGTMLYLRGRLDPEGGAALQTALDALTRPPAVDDPRTAAQRRADALVELARLGLHTGKLPTVGGARPQLGILITPAALFADQPGTAPVPNTTGDAPVPNTGDSGTAPVPSANGNPGTAPTGPMPPGRSPADPLVAARGDPLTAAGVPQLPDRAWLNWMGEVPPALAQRLSCDCEVWRIVLDPSTGLPLEIGRSQRLIPHHIRKALHARDRGCRWPGCDVPTEWTDGHHLLAWCFGGETNVDNLLLLCRWHHGLVHEGRWSIRLDHTTGELHVTRPDGKPYELGPSQPWLGPTTRR